jgi:hypothetical protein
MVIYLSLLVAIIGAFIWFTVADTKPKLQQLGHDMFQCGLLAFLITAVPYFITLATRSH